MERPECSDTRTPAGEARWAVGGNVGGGGVCFLDYRKPEAVVMFVGRKGCEGLLHVVKRVTNVYGEGGVGLQFEAWPMIESTLSRRRDFTRLFANHNDTNGGFYETERDSVILPFLFQEGEPRTWYVHFDLYSPVHSAGSAWKHLRHEFMGDVKPDWRLISKMLES